MNNDAQPQLDGFLENFVQKQEGRRISCLHLYRRYLVHCQKYGLAMAPKAQFAGAVFNHFGILPELMPTGGGQMHNFFPGLIHTGPEVAMARMTPEVKALVEEESPLDYTAPIEKHRAGVANRPRT